MDPHLNGPVSYIKPRRGGFDWTAAQKRICHSTPYTTRIAVRGWPRSWYEFNRCSDPLMSSPEDESNQAFHVVVPSFRGFTWSAGPPRDWTF
ncbi:hypothetical protein F5B20DRAFT_587074 [Whalleya microplaca]|nr:hypothetical protein F5B20DRAFT_587074 [Whalleya microplaca]